MKSGKGRLGERERLETREMMKTMQNERKEIMKTIQEEGQVMRHFTNQMTTTFTQLFDEFKDTMQQLVQMMASSMNNTQIQSMPMVAQQHNTHAPVIPPTYSIQPQGPILSAQTHNSTYPSMQEYSTSHYTNHGSSILEHTQENVEIQHPPHHSSMYHSQGHGQTTPHYNTHRHASPQQSSFDTPS